MSDERRIDEMVIALIGMRDLDNEGRCIVALIQQGFRAYEVADWLDEALTLARMVRAENLQQAGAPDAAP
jgi:2-keto-3-deoxy-6-phosphogluconate aldolase